MMHLRGLATIALARIASGLTQASGLTLDRRALLRGSGAALAAPLLPAQAGSIPTWDLGGGVAMPTLALNTVGLSVEATERAVKFAVDAGVSHVDFHPGIERDGVARGLPSVARKSVFLTTKVAEAPWSVAEWAVALRFDNPRATVLVLVFGDTPLRVWVSKRPKHS